MLKHNGESHLRGNVDDDELPNYYAAADLLVLPSLDRSEGFGLTLLEANATGKPVVASNVVEFQAQSNMEWTIYWFRRGTERL